MPFCKPGNGWSSKVFLLNHIGLEYVSLNSNPWDGNAPSLGNSWEPRKSKMAVVILVNYKMCFCMYSHALRYEEFNGAVYINVRLCSHDQHSKWPPFSPTIDKIEHNLIAYCYINMILFCPFLCFTISGLKRKYFN